jgi:AAA domain/IclR helix-turn-helix domain
VLLCALEDNKRRMQRRLTKLLGVNKTEWPRFSCAHSWPRANAGGLERIRDWIGKAGKPRLVVIDVLARFRKLAPPGKQSYDLDYEAIAELQKIASDTGVAILVIHHTRKGEADDPIDAVSGTLGLAGAADAVLVIDRKPQGVRLYGRSRDVDEIDKAMKFDNATCRWTILGETSDVRRTDERKRIIAALDEEGEPMTPKDIAAAVGQPATNVRGLLRKMAKAGEVTKIKYGLYVLPEPPAAPGNTGHSGNSCWWQERPRDQ